ncbi:sulfate ABC transporter permease subunit CysT [soil metagenome]
MSTSVFKRRVIPGFGLTMGYTMLYLSLIVLIPLSTLVFKSSTLGWSTFWSTVTAPVVMHSYYISFGCALAAGVVNAIAGLAVAWVLVRYRFVGRRVVDAMIDLPFALPTAVAGIALTSLYQHDGWLGSLGTSVAGWINSGITWTNAHVSTSLPAVPEKSLAWLNLDYDFTATGISLALVFIGLPFVVRTIQPVLQDLGKEVEEAAASLGASRWQTFRRVIFPELWPAVLTGFALSVARSLGEYGSVVFIRGNLPMKNEIATNQIIQKLEQYNYAGATSIALVMLLASLVMLLLINVVEKLTVRR